MSSLQILVILLVLSSVLADHQTIYFTQSIYDLWCEENVLSRSLILSPNPIRTGIPGSSDIQSVAYHLINDENNGLFQIHTQRLADFHFFLLTITRPLDINREYQDVYIIHLRANIVTLRGNQTEQTKIRLHVADANDNDAVFDLDNYERTFTEPRRSLFRFHASDADEIHHSQLLYEFSSSIYNETFALHPFTGELYILSVENLQTSYEFDIYAYDRQRKHRSNDKIKSKARVHFQFLRTHLNLHRERTLFNRTIEFHQILSSYQIQFFPTSYWNLLNVHQTILTIEISPHVSLFEIFILNTSSANCRDLFLDRNQIYLNHVSFRTYDLQLLICFLNRTKCQYTSYLLTPPIDLQTFQASFRSIPPLFLEEDLPIQSFIAHVQLQYDPPQACLVDYKLVNDHRQFDLHPKTGVLRLAQRLKDQRYLLEIQADVRLSIDENYSTRTTIEINIQEVNKHRPMFENKTFVELFQLPYQFRAVDFDQNKQTNGRLTYRLWNCYQDCPFEINCDNGVLDFRRNRRMMREKIYLIQVIAFDWGEPISFETRMDVRIDLSSTFIDEDLGRRWTNTSRQAKSQSPPEVIHLNIGFPTNSTVYHLSEDTEIDTIIDRVLIEYTSFPLFIDEDDRESLFFYIINDTSVPFVVDSKTKAIQLVAPLDREKQDHYTFELELRLKPAFRLKLQEIHSRNVSVNFQYYQKKIITVYVDDINDNTPICDSFHQHIYLNENQIQTHLFDVHASDPDQGENGTIVYSLLDYKQYFSIDSHTGQIYSIQPIDREQQSHLLLHILASDQGAQPQLQSICMTLHITVVDVNDNTPRFSLPNYTYHLFSDLPPNTIFGQIYAIDADSDDQLIYSCEFNPFVRVDQHSGYLRLNEELTNQHLNITVYVSDGLHVNQTWIYIDVQHFIAAQPPIFLSESVYEIHLNQSIPIGTVVTNVYHRLELSQSSVDFVQIMNDDQSTPFSIDQQGSIHLVHSLVDSFNSSYWLSIRLTRFRARPSHSFLHVHIAIREDNFYLPKCVNVYQETRIYELPLQRYSLAHVQPPSSFYNHVHLQYSLLDSKIFSIDNRTGFIELMPSMSKDRSLKSNYFLTVRALDEQHQLSVDCYVKVHLIRRHQLTPRFLYSPVYNLDLLEISSTSGRLRQRLFQVIALLNHHIYEKNLEIRYRIVDIHSYFIINHRTGYIASKQALYPYTTHQLNVEAFTIEMNPMDDDEHSARGRWRIVSPRVILPIKVRILPNDITNSSVSSLINEPVINLNLSTSTQVGSTLLQLQRNRTHAQWLTIASHLDHTRYFHINWQSAELILLRPVEELLNDTTTIDLRINVTNAWSKVDTIHVIIRIRDVVRSSIHFSQPDYYISVSKRLAIGTEIAHLTLANPLANCSYNIHSVRRVKTVDLFHLDSITGSLTILESLDTSLTNRHLLTIISRCGHSPELASTRLHVDVLNQDRRNDSYRFSRKNYLLTFDVILTSREKRDLMTLELIRPDHQQTSIKSDAQIINGDPLGLFAINSSDQTLSLLDQSRSRSYTYPLQLTILDTSQTNPTNCTITIFITNIALHFTCPPISNTSPSLFTYHSIPPESIDLFTGHQYEQYNSLLVRGFDPLTPLNQAECSLKTPIQSPDKPVDFRFEKEMDVSYINLKEDFIRVSIKNRNDHPNPFDITYELVHQTNQSSFEIDPYTGVIQSRLGIRFFSQYSLLILARYQSLLVVTRLDIIPKNTRQLIYRFELLYPFVVNTTIGYLNSMHIDSGVLDGKLSSMFSIDDHQRRLFVRNDTLILKQGNAFNFLIGNARIYINIRSKERIQCSLNRFLAKEYLGFVTVNRKNSRRSFKLLNHNDLFVLDRAHGLLRYRNENQTIDNDLFLLIEVDNCRCLIKFQGYSSMPYLMLRNGSDLEMELPNASDRNQSTGQFQLINGTLIHFDLISNRAPIFPRGLYIFSLDISTNPNTRVLIDRISAQAYNPRRSCLVYQLLSSTNHFRIHPENGTLEYIPQKDAPRTIERFQLIARDLIYEQNTTVNITVKTIQSQSVPLIDPDHTISTKNHRPVFFNLPVNLTISSTDHFVTKLSAYDLDFSNLTYYLLNAEQRKIFSIDHHTGILTLTNPSSETFFHLHIAVSDDFHLTTDYLPVTIFDYSPHVPQFSSSEYIFSYNSTLGQIIAYDSDPNDEITYQLYLEADGIVIDRHSGILTVQEYLFPQPIEFFASASDRANQITYTKIQIIFPIDPNFISNQFYISLLPSIELPSKIHHLQLVDSLNQPLTSTRFQLLNQTNLFEIQQNRLVLKERFPRSKIIYLIIRGYWQNLTCQSSFEIKFVYKKLPVIERLPYFHIEIDRLKANLSLRRFPRHNSTLKIVPTPLTTNNCLANFVLVQNELFFQTPPVLSSQCFFELQFITKQTISTSLIKVSFIHVFSKPRFSSPIYNFSTQNIRVFARSLHSIRYRLKANPYGLLIDRTSGVVLFNYAVERLKNFQELQLLVYAIDERTGLNDTAWIHIRLHSKKQWEIPKEISVCSQRALTISDRSVPGTIIGTIDHPTNKSNRYYILDGDRYGLFSISTLGQVHLVTSILQRTPVNDFSLIILMASSTLSYCRMNISSIRWSELVCPEKPIEWMIEEECAIGTRIGNIKETLGLIDTSSPSIEMNILSNESEIFHLNSSSGLLTSKSRLDYEQTSVYSLIITLVSKDLNCSVFLSIKLININDHPLSFDRTSLIYTIPRKTVLPFYIGRIRIIDIDQLNSIEYQYYLSNPSSYVTIDSRTGSILLHHDVEEERLIYEIMIIDERNQKNYTDLLVIHKHNLSLFEKDLYQINISPTTAPGTIIFSRNSTSNITYTLLETSPLFTIDRSTGSIYFNGSFSSKITNFTLIIQALENEMSLIDQATLILSMTEEDSIYFNLTNQHQCFIDEHQLNGTSICTIGKDLSGVLYRLVDPPNFFQIFPNNGTILNRKVFDYHRDKHQYILNILALDRNNQSIVLSTLNTTVHLRRSNEHFSITEVDNFTTLFFFFYPSINTTLYRIEHSDHHPTSSADRILNDTSSDYILHQSSNTTELRLIRPMVNDGEDRIIIRLWTDIHLHLVYQQHQLISPRILTRTIDGYINTLSNASSIIDLGQLFLENHSHYRFCSFDLLPNDHFFFKQISHNHTELYFRTFPGFTLFQLSLRLIPLATFESMPNILLSNKTKIFLPSTFKHQTIDIHLWPMTKDMFDRTVSMILNTTSHQFHLQNLTFIRQQVARMIGIHAHHVHLYSFQLKQNQLKLLIAILGSTSERYIHKRFLSSALQTPSDYCQLNPCENEGRCTSSIRLIDNQYEYISSETSRYVIPKYEWNRQCLCSKDFHGERCQSRQSPCSSSPCLPTEKYVDDSLFLEKTLECININSPSCRDISNTVTFDGNGFIRMNFTTHRRQSMSVEFSFRTYTTQGTLVELIYFEKRTNGSHSLIIEIIDGYLTIEFNEIVVFLLRDLSVDDGQWHDLYFEVDYSQNYYLLRIDQVFSHREPFSSKQVHQLQLKVGTEFHGCLGNLTFDHQQVRFDQNNHLLEVSGTSPGCHIIEEYPLKDDLCSLYHPCYHGGICVNNQRTSFTCNCSQERFTGRQCQSDLFPCRSYPCSFEEQCLPLVGNTNVSFECVRTLGFLSKTMRRFVYIGTSFVFSLCVVLMGMICKSRRKHSKHFSRKKPIVSGPFINQTSTCDRPESPLQTLLKHNDHGKQTMETILLSSQQHLYESMHHANDVKFHSSLEPMSMTTKRSSIHDNPRIIHPIDVYTSYTRFRFHSSSENLSDQYNFDLSDSTSDASDNDQHPLTFAPVKRRLSFFNHHHIPTSSLSLANPPIYARIVKTRKIHTTTGTSFIKPLEKMDMLPIHRFRYASDSDLLQETKSTKLASFFQTDV